MPPPSPPPSCRSSGTFHLGVPEQNPEPISEGGADGLSPRKENVDGSLGERVLSEVGVRVPLLLAREREKGPPPVTCQH